MVNRTEQKLLKAYWYTARAIKHTTIHINKMGQQLIRIN